MDTITSPKFMRFITNKITIVIAVVIAFAALYIFQVCIAKNSAITYTDKYNASLQHLENVVFADSGAVPFQQICNSLSPSEFQFLRTTFMSTKECLNANQELLSSSLGFYAGNSTCLLVAVILSGIFVTYIMKKGIDGVLPSVRSAFYTFLFMSAFFGVLNLVYQHEENIANFQSIYHEYYEVEYEIYNYMATGCGHDLASEHKLVPGAFINYINRKVSQIEIPEYGIDPDKVSKVREFLNPKSATEEIEGAEEYIDISIEDTLTE